jgi:hypothetical protein
LHCDHTNQSVFRSERLLAEITYWHGGRCVHYGEGVAFWTLAEMVRQRFERLGAAPDMDRARASAQRQW